MRLGDSKKSAAALGFFTVVEHEQHGLFGGYLLLNSAGRPLEFHCTAPVKPSRAQEILFGPTLLPYLYGEQIGQALLAKSSQAPMVVCTDRADGLALREYIQAPVAWVMADEPAPAASGRLTRIDNPGDVPHFHLGRSRLVVSRGHSADQAAIEAALAEEPAIDLCEPFERIRGAIEEAQRGGR